MRNQEIEEPAPLANIEAEAALLGALMIDNVLVDRVRAIVDETMFYMPSHGRIFRTIAKFTDAGRIANPVSMKPLFDMDPGLKEVGGASYLAQLTGSGASLIGAFDFAAQVRDLANMRRLREAVDRGIERMAEDGNFEDMLAEVEIAVSRASTSIRQVDLYTAEQMIDLTVNRSDQAVESGIPGASCRLVRDMDTLLGKIEGGQMTIIAGRPGMGKSTLAMSASLGYALNGDPGLYALAESSAEMFALKLTSDILHAAGKPLPFKTIKEGILSREERSWLVRAREVAETIPIKFGHIGRSDVKRVAAICARENARLRREGKRLAFCVVDYLQLLTAEGRHRVGDSVGRVNAVSEGLLEIAQKENLHMIALSQLSRGVEGRDDKRPRLSDLRESGRLEEDADNVLMVYREEYYLEKEKPTQEGKEMEAWLIDIGHARGKVELIAAKTRFGANASRKANFLGEFSAVRGSNWHATDAYSDEDNSDLFERFGA